MNYILQRVRDAGEEVYEKAREIVEEGMSRSSITLKGSEKRVEVSGKEYVVKVLSGGAEFDKSRDGKLLLRIRITAEVDGVRNEYTITFSKYRKDNAIVGHAYARADAPGSREVDVERFSALIKALTGKEPWITRMKIWSDNDRGRRNHLDGFARFAELADVIEKWLEETSR